MKFSILALSAVLAATATAMPNALKGRQESLDACQTAYKACIASGAGEDPCNCSLATCVGEDDADERSACLSVSSRFLATSTGFVGSASTAAASASATSTFVPESADACQDEYKKCVASGATDDLCKCDLATCVGEDNARTREYCASVSSQFFATSGRAASTAVPAPTVYSSGSQPTTTAPVVTPTTYATQPATYATRTTPAPVPVPPVYTGAADRVKPALALIAFGAMALL